MADFRVHASVDNHTPSSGRLGCAENRGALCQPCAASRWLPPPAEAAGGRGVSPTSGCRCSWPISRARKELLQQLLAIVALDRVSGWRILSPRFPRLDLRRAPASRALGRNAVGAEQRMRCTQELAKCFSRLHL